MKAVVLTAINQLTLSDIADPLAKEGEVVVSLKAAALNHRDVWIKSGQYAGLKFPAVLGSDGVGVVTSLGHGVDPSWLGREVVINPSFGWGSSEFFQGPDFSILGLPRDGTFAQKIAVPVSQISEKPAWLSWESAAALPLAGLTAFRALFSRAQLKVGERLLITGIGGGVALQALQFAVAAGAEVWVTSSSNEKLAKAISLGASGGFLYTHSNWSEEVSKQGLSFNVIMDSAGGAGFDALLDLAAPGARVVFFGATRGNPSALAMRKVFWRQLSLLGTTMGSPQNWSAMLAFVEKHKITPIAGHAFPLDQAHDAFALMEQGAQWGKIVLLNS